MAKKVDFTEEGEIEQLVKDAVEKFGKISAVLNNVGWGANTPLFGSDSQKMIDGYKLNTLSAYNLNKFNQDMDTEAHSKLVKGAILTGVINAAINGGIQYFFLKGHQSIPISADSITNNDETVLGTAVVLAITLSMILTLVAYFGIKGKKAPLWPTTIWLTIKHGFFTFGVLTSLAVLWQKYMGTVEVSLIPALLIIGVIAGVVSGIINYLTLKRSVVIQNQ